MDGLSIALTDAGGIPAITVAGDVDIASAPRLDEMLTTVRERGGDALIVSLQRCDYCDSTGLSVLIKHAKDIPNFCVVVPPESYLRKIFRTTNLEERLGVVDSVAAAIRQSRALSPA